MRYWFNTVNEALKYKGYTISGAITGAPPILAYAFELISKDSGLMEWIPSFAISGIAGSLAIAFFISLELVKKQKLLAACRT